MSSSRFYGSHDALQLPSSTAHTMDGSGESRHTISIKSRTMNDPAAPHCSSTCELRILCQSSQFCYLPRCQLLCIDLKNQPFAIGKCTVKIFDISCCSIEALPYQLFMPKASASASKTSSAVHICMPAMFVFHSLESLSVASVSPLQNRAKK